MSRLPIFAGIVNDVVFKADAALLVLVGELEVVKDFPAFGSLKLLLFVRLQTAECFRIQLVCVDGLSRSDRVRGEKDAS